MANAGLTVKERLALLHNNNNNNSNSNRNSSSSSSSGSGSTAIPSKPTGGQGKAVPSVSPKPKPSPEGLVESAKPPGLLGFKPTTPSKPAAATPVGPKPPAEKPKPATAIKPLLGAKPGANTFSAPPSGKAGSGDRGKADGQDVPRVPKLHPPGSSPAKKVTPPVSQKPTPRGGGGGGGEDREVSIAETNCSSGTGGGSDSSGEMPEQGGGAVVVTPTLSHVSVQERLAALMHKSDGDTMDTDSKPNHAHRHHPNNNPVSPLPPKPSSSKPVFPPPSRTPPAMPPHRHPPPNSKPAGDSAGVKPSDIAKDLDRALRSRAAGGGGADSSGGKASPGRLVQRRSDGKTFRQVNVRLVLCDCGPPPAKPCALSNVDLKPFLRAYAAAKEEKLKADARNGSVQAKDDGSTVEEEEGVEELYVEAESTSITIRGRKGSTKRANTARVSFIIPEFTEEEEVKEFYTDGKSTGQIAASPVEPEETYDDCQSALEELHRQQALPQEPEEIYEPLDEESPQDQEPPGETEEFEMLPPPLPSPNTTEDRRSREKDRENREKERKERVKDEASRKEEKERKKKEEEIKKLRKKFGLNEGDDKVGDGVVKSSAGGGVFSRDLAVVKGETIAILRMDGNPPGKWLVQNDQGKLGYVTSNNIEISTPTIRELMAGVKHEAAANEEPEETYEPLPEDDMEEIYEEL